MRQKSWNHAIQRKRVSKIKEYTINVIILNLKYVIMSKKVNINRQTLWDKVKLRIDYKKVEIIWQIVIIVK